MLSFPIENSPRLKFVKTYLWKRGSQSALFSCHPCSPYSLIKRFSFMNPFHFITRIESNESEIQCYYHACHANQKESWKWYQVQRTQNRAPCSQIWKNAVDGATDRMSCLSCPLEYRTDTAMIYTLQPSHKQIHIHLSCPSQWGECLRRPNMLSELRLW
jgi:hypothetical protein